HPGEQGRRGRARDAQRQRDVVGRQARLPAVDEPEPLLGEGEGERGQGRGAARDAVGRRRRALLLLAPADLLEQERPLLARQTGQAVLGGRRIAHRPPSSRLAAASSAWSSSGGSPAIPSIPLISRRASSKSPAAAAA